MSSDWARGMFDRLTINPRRTTAAAARKKSMQEAIPGLPDHLVVEHIVRSEYFDDPADLARLPAVSRAMRAAVAATGLQFVQLDEEKALKLGCLSALQRLQRQGRLSRQENLCAAAARSGLLEELKVLRANGCPWDWRTCSGACPWDWRTCSGAAEGGNLEVLQWARANGCYWDANTCSGAAEGGHLEVLQWALANGCFWNEYTCAAAAGGGHLELLQWARANGCPWDEDTCMESTEANGCDWDEITCLEAAEGGHLDLPVGCPWDARGTRRRARGRQGAGISRSCSGRAQTAARGTRARARLQRRVDTCRCFSGRSRIGALGTIKR